VQLVEYKRALIYCDQHSTLHSRIHLRYNLRVPMLEVAMTVFPATHKLDRDRENKDKKSKIKFERRKDKRASVCA
jgi:hypothetical protein